MTMTKPNAKKQFTKTWSTSPYKYRNVRFFLKPTEEQIAFLLNIRSSFKNATNKICRHYYKGLRNKTFAAKNLKNKSYAEVISEEFSDYLEASGFYFARWKRGISFNVMRILKSFIKRNRKLPSRTPAIDDKKATYFQDTIIKDMNPDDSNGSLGFVLMQPKVKNRYLRENIAYEIPERMMNKKPFVSDCLGGNLEHKNDKWIFTVKADIPFEWLYQPECVVGFDLNMNKESFITLNHKLNGQLKIARVDKITSLCRRVCKLNKEIKKPMSYKKRRGLRKKCIKAHKQLETACFGPCREIVDWAKQNKALICIDQLTVGTRTGTFGHDKVIKIITTLCEDERVPFIKVPTKLTSQKCNLCGHLAERETVDVLNCKMCGRLDAQLNAANNIAEAGWFIWFNGMDEFKKSVKYLDAELFAKRAEIARLKAKEKTAKKQTGPQTSSV
jgi:hypothetical protein